MFANAKQVGGNHYESEYQHWDFVKDTNMSYFPAMIVKYITRWRRKNGVEDLYKALHFAEKWREELEAQEELIKRYVAANNLSHNERLILEDITQGRGFAALTYLINYVEIMESAEPQPHGYVDQD